jgi:hypothetical protein
VRLHWGGGLYTKIGNSGHKPGHRDSQKPSLPCFPAAGQFCHAELILPHPGLRPYGVCEEVRLKITPD